VAGVGGWAGEWRLACEMQWVGWQAGEMQWLEWVGGLVSGGWHVRCSGWSGWAGWLAAVALLGLNKNCMC
jgi:hypothetical protein